MLRLFLLRFFFGVSLLSISLTQANCQKSEPSQPQEKPAPAAPEKPPKPPLESFIAPEARIMKSTTTEKQMTITHLDLPIVKSKKNRDIIVPFFFAEEGFKFFTIHTPIFKSAEGCEVKDIVLESPIDSDDLVFLLDWESDITEGLYSRYEQKDLLMGAPMHNVGIQFQAPKECKTIDFEFEAEFFLE